jgi:excisionase family DNA binding protein
MTIAEAATYLRVGTSTVSLLAQLHLEGFGRDHMPAIRVGNEIRIIRDRLAANIDTTEPGTGR